MLSFHFFVDVPMRRRRPGAGTTIRPKPCLTLSGRTNEARLAKVFRLLNP